MSKSKENNKKMIFSSCFNVMLKFSYLIDASSKWGGPAQGLATLWNHRFLSTGSDNPGLGSVLLKAQLASAERNHQRGLRG